MIHFTINWRSTFVLPLQQIYFHLLQEFQESFFFYFLEVRCFSGLLRLMWFVLRLMRQLNERKRQFLFKIPVILVTKVSENVFVEITKDNWNSLWRTNNHLTLCKGSGHSFTAISLVIAGKKRGRIWKIKTQERWLPLILMGLLRIHFTPSLS